MKILNKITGIILILGVFSFFVYVYTLNVYCIPKRLKNYGVMLNGWTLEWKFDSKGGRSLEYEFYFKGKKIIGYTSLSKNNGNGNFVHTYFPLIYDTIHGHERMLIEPKDFKEFNIDFPDSLNWVLPYVKD